MLGLHRLTQSWEVTANPWHPPAPPALPSLSPAAPRPGAMGRPRHPSTGAGGTPRLGIPGTYLAVPAPRPPACVPSHRGSAALCLVKPIMHRLYSSPSPQHPLLPRSSAWHGPGAQGVPWQRVGVMRGANLHSGARSGSAHPSPAHPGECPKPQEESCLKFHPSSPVPPWEAPCPAGPVLHNPPSGEPGCEQPPPFPPSMVGAEPQPRLWDRKDIPGGLPLLLGHSTAPPNPPGEQ